MKRILLLILLLTLMPALAAATPQSTTFTYQGRLLADGHPANGNYDLEFKLFDSQAVGSGTQVGTTITMPQFPVVNGLFTTDLDFPGAFTGAQLWLEVAVDGETLDARQPVNSVPVAQYALSAVPAPVFLSSASSLEVGTGPAGLPGDAAVMPLSGHVESVSTVLFFGSTLDLMPNAALPPPQVLPTNGTFGSIRASFFVLSPPSALETVVLTVQLYTSAAPGTTLFPVPGAYCHIAVPFSTLAGQVLTCTQDGLSIPYAAGAEAAIAITGTSQNLIVFVSGAMSVSIGP